MHVSYGYQYCKGEWKYMYAVCGDLYSFVVVRNVRIRKVDSQQTYLLRFHKVSHAPDIIY